MEETNRIQCKHCGEYFDECDLTLIDNRDCKEYYVCENCYDTNYITCEDCGNAILSDEDNYIVDCNGNYICSDCMDDYYMCSRCEEYYHESSMHWHEGANAWFCDECYEEIHEDSDMEDVNYSMVELDNDKTYLGFELEVGSENYGDSQISYQIRNILGRDYLLNIHHDGSICDDGINFGGEIVSQPLTIEQINSKDFRDRMQQVVDLLLANGLMQKCYTCGFHVHFTRKGNEDIAKLYLLSNFFESEFESIGGRYNCSNWCEILNRSTDYTELKDYFENDEDTRYVFWNRQNGGTIECRAFESNLDVDVIIQRLNVVYRCALLSRTAVRKNITWDYLVSGSTSVDKRKKVLSIDTLSFIKKAYYTKWSMERIKNKINSYARAEIMRLIEEDVPDNIGKIHQLCRGIQDIMTRKTQEGIIVRIKNNREILPQTIIDYGRKLNYVDHRKGVQSEKLVRGSVVRIKDEKALIEMVNNNHEFEVPSGMYSSYTLRNSIISQVGGMTVVVSDKQEKLFNIKGSYLTLHTDMIEEVLEY